jgi:2'-5' RNA ligase
MINYPSQTPGDYPLFIGAFLSGDLAERLQTFRRRHSTGTDRFTGPHVTLVRSFWRSGPATSENEAETMTRLRAIQDQIQPFELGLGGVRAFLSPKRVIYMAVEPTTDLPAARRKLLEALELDDHRPFTPHLTLAKGLDQDQFEMLLAQLEQSEWHTGRWSVSIDQLWLMQRGPDEPAWRCIQRLRLAGVAQDASGPVPGGGSRGMVTK